MSAVNGIAFFIVGILGFIFFMMGLEDGEPGLVFTGILFGLIVLTKIFLLGGGMAMVCPQ